MNRWSPGICPGRKRAWRQRWEVLAEAMGVGGRTTAVGPDSLGFSQTPHNFSSGHSVQILTCTGANTGRASLSEGPQLADSESRGVPNPWSPFTDAGRGFVRLGWAEMEALLLGDFLPPPLTHSSSKEQCRGTEADRRSLAHMAQQEKSPLVSWGQNSDAEKTQSQGGGQVG